MPSSTMPYIGNKISLISNSKVRYEGILHEINTQETTIALRSVRSFGTEGRKVPEIPPSGEIYDLIIFPGQDIDDLTTLERSDAGQGASPHLNDPAIMSMKKPASGPGMDKGAMGKASPQGTFSYGGGAMSDLFYSTLQHAEVLLQNAHCAALGTMEAELKHMRYENMRLRRILKEAGLGEKANVATAFGAMEAKEEEKPKSSTADAMPSCEDQDIKVQSEKEASPPCAERQQASATAVTASSNAQWIPVNHEGSRSASMTTVSTATPTSATATSPDGIDTRSKEDLSSVGMEEQHQSNAAHAARAARATVPLGKTLEAMLAQWGWQHLEAEILSESDDVALASIGGTKLKLRMEHSKELRQLGRLLAWDEDGNIWQALDVLIRKKRLQKVVRACPVAATREFTPDNSESESIQANVEVVHAGRSQLRTPLTLAQLEALPIETPVKPMRHRKKGR